MDGDLTRARQMQLIQQQLQQAMRGGHLIEPIGDNIYRLSHTVFGPNNSGYQGGLFEVLVVVPDRYPVVPPAVYFRTRIFHPNVSPTDGRLHLSVLGENWNRQIGLLVVFNLIPVILERPDPDAPSNHEAARLYQTNYIVYTSVVMRFPMVFVLPPWIQIMDFIEVEIVVEFQENQQELMAQDNEQEQPVNEQEVQPVNEQEVQPVNEQEVQPVNEQEVQPVNEQEVQPVNEQEVQPVNEQEVQPVNEQEVQPVKRARMDENQDLPPAKKARTDEGPSSNE